jgi:hypothetical protein
VARDEQGVRLAIAGEDPSDDVAVGELGHQVETP